MIVLPEVQILSPLFCFSKKRLFEEIAKYSSYILEKDPKDIIRALNEREQLGTTVFFDGIAMPHAVIDSKVPTFSILSILDKPITFNSIDADEQLIDIAFSIFINKKDDIQKVESLLKNLTIVLSNVDLLNSLRLAKTEKPKRESGNKSSKRQHREMDGINCRRKYFEKERGRGNNRPLCFCFLKSDDFYIGRA